MRASPPVESGEWLKCAWEKYNASRVHNDPCGGKLRDAGWATQSAALIERNLAAGRGARSAFADDCGERGYNAGALVGGITAWHAIGGTTVPLDISTYEEAP
jgi:hypothetical protein